jgi:DNA-binding GntR family transcriptional regulator
MMGWNPEPTTVMQTRDEYVAQQIRDAIRRGEIEPGYRLDQNELAELFDVSRSPVREAIRTLAAEGLVTVYPHRGAVVAELSREELEEVVFIRSTLEGLAARLSVPSIDDQRIERLQTVLQQLDEVVEDEWATLNREFHHTIYRAVERPRLLSFIQQLRNISAPYVRRYITSPDRLETARIGHHRIFEACQKRDGDAAEIETQKHLEGVFAYINALMDSSEPA